MPIFNPHILLVIRWLINPDSVSEKELGSNYDAAADAYYARAVYDAAAACAVAAAANARAAAATAANAARYAATAAEATAADVADVAAADVADVADVAYLLAQTKERLDKYFELSGEDKEAYKERAKYLNVLT